MCIKIKSDLDPRKWDIYKKLSTKRKDKKRIFIFIPILIYILIVDYVFLIVLANLVPVVINTNLSNKPGALLAVAVIAIFIELPYLYATILYMKYVIQYLYISFVWYRKQKNKMKLISEVINKLLREDITIKNLEKFKYSSEFLFSEIIKEIKESGNLFINTFEHFKEIICSKAPLLLYFADEKINLSVRKELEVISKLFLEKKLNKNLLLKSNTAINKIFIEFNKNNKNLIEIKAKKNFYKFIQDYKEIIATLLYITLFVVLWFLGIKIPSL